MKEQQRKTLKKQEKSLFNRVSRKSYNAKSQKVSQTRNPKPNFASTNVCSRRSPPNKIVLAPTAFKSSTAANSMYASKVVSPKRQRDKKASSQLHAYQLQLYGKRCAKASLTPNLHSASSLNLSTVSLKDTRQLRNIKSNVQSESVLMKNEDKYEAL